MIFIQIEPIAIVWLENFKSQNARNLEIRAFNWSKQLNSQMVQLSHFWYVILFSGFVGMRGKKGQRYMGKPILPDVLQRYVRAGFVGMRG